MKLEYVTTIPDEIGRIVGLATFREKVAIVTESGYIYTLERHDGGVYADQTRYLPHTGEPWRRLTTSG